MSLGSDDRAQSLVDPRSFERLFIGGDWVESVGDRQIEVIDPTTEEAIATVPEGTPEDVERAVSSAREAFVDWSEWPLADRAQLMSSIGSRLGEMSEEIARTISLEVGTPIELSRTMQAGLPKVTFASMADLAAAIEEPEGIGHSVVLREPAGIVAAITPWNYPLHQVAAKVAPALTAGCTVVLKPSEVAPLTAFALAEVGRDVGLPAGVLNIVTGLGPVVGEALVGHPAVDMVSFTGSTRAGRRIGQVSSGSVKRLALELGGKSANVILDDADFERAIPDGVARCFLNGGQSCNALSRMLVPRARLDTAKGIARSAAEAFVCGDPLDAVTTLGPMASAHQRTRVSAFIRDAQSAGAALVTGGPEAPDGLDAGYFVRPTVFSDVDTDMRIAREEVFGPVLSLIPYDSEEDAVAIANDTVYGLSGGVWSSDREHAWRVARRLRTGQVAINGARFNPLAPFGGFKQSGIGRELGRYGLSEFLEVKAVHQ